MEIAQKLAGYTLGKADLLRRAMGKKKKEVLDAEFVRFERGHAGQRLQRRPRSRRCGTSWSPSPTTPSTRRTPRPTGWCPTGPPTSRRTTRPSTWPRCSPACATTRTSPRSTSTSAGAWASRCCRPTSTSRSANFAAVGTDIRFGLAAIRNVGANVVDGDRRGARGQGPLHLVQGLPEQGPRGGLQQAHHRVADQGRRLRRPAAHPPGPGAGARGLRRRLRRRQAQGGHRPGLASSAAFGDDADGGDSVDFAVPAADPRRSSGTSRRCWPSSARCSASTSPTTRCSASSTS